MAYNLGQYISEYKEDNNGDYPAGVILKFNGGHKFILNPGRVRAEYLKMQIPREGISSGKYISDAPVITLQGDINLLDLMHTWAGEIYVDAGLGDINDYYDCHAPALANNNLINIWASRYQAGAGEAEIKAEIYKLLNM
jgi:hypothetical protein